VTGEVDGRRSQETRVNILKGKKEARASSTRTPEGEKRNKSEKGRCNNTIEWMK